MSDSKNIPLNKLAAWDGNVRKTAGADTALAELASSIQSIGLLQPLVVRQTRKSNYAVVAGSRRLAALSLLAKSGKIEADHAVPCTLLPAEIDATEASLAENVMREHMHPADEFEAFRAMADKGIPAVAIAAKFGVTETVVLKRLKLARVHPVIINAYRAGEIDLEAVMAFAVTDDQKAQGQLWKRLSQYERGNAYTIRRALTEKEVKGSDSRVRFVTLKAYEKAGGTVRRDLFADSDDGLFIDNIDLLDGLVAKKLEKAAATVRKEGWAWVEIRETFDFAEKSKFRQLRQSQTPLTPELQAEHDSLDKERGALYEIEGDLTDEQEERLSFIDLRMDEILETQEEVWPDGIFDYAGAIVSIGYNGKSEIERGLIKPGDVKKIKLPKETGSDDTSASAIAESTGLSAKLNEELTKQRTAAIGAELIDRPDIALAAIVYSLAGEAFIERFFGDSCLEITAKTALRARDAVGDANDVIERHRANWGEQLPGDAQSLWAWCLKQERETMLDLLAFCTALTVDAVAAKGSGPDHGHQLAEALKLDMTKWFTPTAENYFSSISKAQILEVLKEVKVPARLSAGTSKKPELAALAERQIAGSGWLPAPLRPSPHQPGGRSMDAG